MRRLCLLVAFCLTLASPMAAAADLRGVWRLDETAWQAQMARLITEIAARLPPEVRAGLEAQGVDPVTALQASMVSPIEGSVEFLDDGSVQTVTEADGRTTEGRWSLDGDTLRVEVDDGAGGRQPMVGSIAGDRISLRPAIANPSPEEALLARIVVPLVRRP